MSIFGRLRLDIQRERVEISAREQDAEVRASGPAPGAIQEQERFRPRPVRR